MKDQRSATRYDLSLPVVVRASRDKAVSRIGKTREISNRGIYFTIDNDFIAGAKLGLTMFLTAEITGGNEVFIRAIGKVIRVDKPSWSGDQNAGVAAVFEKYEIVRSRVDIT